MDKIYCFFGDSVTQAAYVKRGWVDLLREYLEKKDKDNFINVFNLGIGGNTTEDILNRFEEESQKRNPTSVIFAVGINDIKFEKENQFRKNIKSLIEKSKMYTSDITFIGLVLGSDIPEENFSLTKAKRYDQIIKEISNSGDCRFIELFDKLSSRDFMDGLHPNDIGHKKMFEEIKKYF